MADLISIGDVAKALGVSVETLRRWEAAGRVTFIRHNNRRMLPADQLANLLVSHGARSTSSSARNRLAGVVTAVKRDDVMAQVELSCGDYRVVSLMSREAADELGLAPGVHASAVIKATNVVVER
ncbi:MAG TPA: TOBE domain-containing protein [Mycobacteriales bacterium]|jgi:molybdopterin-binding protein|nr:TOBE domain-containing protein [Mycobacteriales bacterium]